MGLGDDLDESCLGTLFKDVKYYVVGSIPSSVSAGHFLTCSEAENVQ